MTLAREHRKSGREEKRLEALTGACIVPVSEWQMCFKLASCTCSQMGTTATHVAANPSRPLAVRFAGISSCDSPLKGAAILKSRLEYAMTRKHMGLSHVLDPW
jgi:hypothetical protein